MTFHCILGMWMDDWGYELSETFRVTPQGADASATSSGSCSSRADRYAAAMTPRSQSPFLYGQCRERGDLRD